MSRLLNTPWLLILAAFLVAALIGVLLSLLFLIPPLRRLGQRATAVRRLLAASLGLLALLIVFGSAARVFAEAVGVVISGTVDSYRPAIVRGSPQEQLVQKWDQNRAAVVNELWLRQMMPPRQAWACYTRRFEVCILMADEFGLWGSSTWWSWLVMLGLGVVSGLVCGALAARFMRPWIQVPVTSRATST